MPRCPVILSRMSPDPGQVTMLLRRMRGGDADAKEALGSLIYSELRKIASVKMWGEAAGSHVDAHCAG